MSDIIINRSGNGLGITRPTEDHILGAIFYNDYLPEDWDTSIDAWVTATEYVIGDKVYDAVSKNFYIANTAHTAGATFAADVANWDVYTKTVKKFSSLTEVESTGIVKGSADWAYEWYQLSEIYRIDPNAEVYVYVAAVPAGAYDYTELNSLMIQSGYKPRNVGIFAQAVTFATSELTTIQTLIDSLITDFKTPLNVIYTADITSFATVSALPDLTTVTAPNLAVVIGRDAGNYGTTLGEKSNLGAALGVISQSKVSDSIAWVEQYNVANVEMETVALSNGLLVADLSKTDLDLLNTKHYLAYIKRPRVTGTYFNDSYTAVVGTSDYSTLENNRVYNKSYIGVVENCTPLVNSPLVVDSAGRMTPGTITNFETRGSVILEAMKENVEISGYTVYVNPSQNVISAQKVLMDIRMTPVGVGRNLEFTLGFEIG